MKRLLCMSVITILLAVGSIGCGGGGTGILGPILSLGEIMSLKLDQFFINGGMDDEYRDYGEFAVYIRDAATGVDVACTRPEGGMSVLTAPGIYYAGLSVNLEEVDGERPDSVARFKLIFVEKDGAACPQPIGPEDDIAGESAELTSDQLVGTLIWATNGLAAAVLRSGDDEPMAVGSMASSMADGLSIDKLFFEGDDGEDNSRYYIYAEKIVGGQVVSQCQIDDAFMEKIRRPNILYAALGFPFSCLDPADPDFVNTRVRIGLYVQRDSGPELVGETEPTPIGDLIGERADFTDGNGYMTFRQVSTAFFGATVVRLADLAAMEVTRLEFGTNPSTDSPLELHAMDPATGVTLACAGAAQGLVGIGAAGIYENLAAAFVAMDGQMELFGADLAVVSLVERTDGNACPEIPEADLPAIAETQSLDSTDLREDQAAFSGGGRIDFVEQSEN